MEFEIYRCSHCGNIITEKHVPVVTINGNKVLVKVGEITHPMIDTHYIEWIILRTNKKVMIQHLQPGESPEAMFTLEEGESVVEAYEYCNLHGLWKK